MTGQAWRRLGVGVVMCAAVGACDTGGTANGGDTSSCTKMASQGCYDTEIYWFDSCGQVDHVATYCTAPEECVVGDDGTPVCQDTTPACTPDAERHCSVNDVYAYDSCGNKGALVDTCGVGSHCAENADGDGVAACVASGCTPDVGCSNLEYCDTTTGTCKERICTPYASVCVDGDVHQCDGYGGSTTFSATCTDGKRCTDGPGGAGCRCVTADYRACVAGDVYWFDSCGAQGQRYEDCTAPKVCVEADGDASCQAPTTCTSNADCDPAEWCDTETGACKPDVCSTFESLCDGDQVVRCKVGGSGYEVLDTCEGGEVCVATSTSASCKCQQGASLGCYDGDVYNFDSCGVRGPKAQTCNAPKTCVAAGATATCDVPATCASDADCYANQWCDTATGECKPDVCTAGPATCADGQVVSCLGNGSGFQVLDTCAGGEACVATSTSASCKCQLNGDLGCYNGDVYTFDSCGNRKSIHDYCMSPESCVADGGTATCALPPTCASNADCYANQWCEAATGECKADVCSTFYSVCDGEQVVRCRADGSGYDVVDTCAGGEACVATATSASCKCELNATLGCDAGDVYHFDSCGVRGTRQADCVAPQTCVDTGSSIACGLPTTCGSDADCYASSWCDTASGECKPDVCTPGAKSCADGEVLTCAANGSGTTVSDTCTGGEVCVAGTNSASCQCVLDGTLGCYNDDVYTYDSCGNRKTLSRYCAAPEICVADGATADCALPPVCASNADCYSHQWCDVESGECRLDVCSGTTSFCSGQTVQRCKVDGSGIETLDTCVGGEVCVTGSGSATCACVLGDFKGCYNTDIYNFDSCGNRKTLAAYCTAPEVCQIGADGVAYCGEPVTCTADSQCASGRFCDVDHCTDQVCTPGARQCDGDTLLRCDTRGSAWEALDECTGGEVCGPVNNTLVCSCTANAYLGCWNGNVERFNSCGNPTSVAESCGLQSPCQERETGPECRSIYACDTDADCADDEFCELDVCLSQVCAPGARFCDGQTIRECNANGSDSVVVTDCGAGELCGVTNAGPQCGCEADASIGCGADGHVHSFDSCGREGAILETCESPLTCVAAGAGATCSDATSCGNDCTCATTGTEACYYGDLYQVSSCNEPVVLVEDCPGQITCNAIGGDPACRSSVASEDATYYERSCGLVHQIEHPTILEGDCRCSNNRVPVSGIAECVSAQYLDPAVSFGTGTRVRPLAQPHINGGFFDAAARELVVGVDWSSAAHPESGLVLAVNVDSGNRRLISGGYEGASGFTETGSGPTLHKVIDVQRGPDGKLYALSVPGSSVDLEIVRIDPTNGNRTLVWRAQDPTFMQCPSGDPARLGVQVNDRGFAVDDQGRFYLPFTNTSPYGEGVGVVRIAADGGACSFVTRSGAQYLNDYAGQDVGGGYLFDRGRYQGFTLKDGALWAIQNAYLTLVKVDLATGNRTRISSASTSAVLGGGPTGAAGIGQRWVVYDDARDLWWASGTLNRRMLTAVDPATGDRTEAFCQTNNPDRPWRDLCLGGALIAGYQNEGGMWVDTANGDLLLVHENFSIVRVDVVNGNSIRISL
ncbi:MAG: hypothetical protein EP329_20245 [Deltaproteobacteria bacterium]|nr:MAG: hypothetical protein EP329_20245 [Deltaproteobacteria bacterium]